MSFERFTYAVRDESVDGKLRYFAAFIDGAGNQQEVKIPREVYLALEDCRRDTNRQIASIKRHQERFDLSEGQLAARATASSAGMEERVEMRAALTALTETQRRRFILWYEHGLTHEQIAVVEGCSTRAVEYSVAAARESIKKYFDE